MNIGYIRDSGFDAIPAPVQRERLQAAGCKRLVEESNSTEGVELTQLLTTLQHGDKLFVPSLVQLGRPIKMVLELVTELTAQGIEFISLEEDLIFTSSKAGPVLTAFNHLLKMNLALVNERTKRSLSIAKATGRIGGRPTTKLEDQLVEIELLLEKDVPVRAIAKSIGTSHTTLYRFIKSTPRLKKYAR